MHKAFTCVLGVFVLFSGTVVYAQAGDGTSGGLPPRDSSAATTSTGQTSPTGDPKPDTTPSPAPASSTPPLAVASSTASTPPSTPTGNAVATTSPATFPVTQEALPDPQVFPPFIAPISHPSPLDPLEANTGENISMLLSIVLAGATFSLIGGVLVAARAKKKIPKSDPCGALQKKLELAQSAHEMVTERISMQERIITQLERSIVEVRDALKGKIQAQVRHVAVKMTTEILEAEKSGILEESLALAGEAKVAYEQLSKRYKQAKELMEILQARAHGLSNEVREQQALLQICQDGVAALTTNQGGGEKIATIGHVPEEKTILVDAIDAFVTDEGIFREMYDLLETYPHRKILLTGANDEQCAKFSLGLMPYEVFTQKHNPEKTDPQYYELMLRNFGLSKDDVIYFEHNEQAAQSAISVGIPTYHYDSATRDLQSLKQFLDTQLTSPIL